MNNSLVFTAFVGLAVVAVLQAYKYIKDKQWESLLTIVVAALVGIVAGLGNLYGMDVPTAVTIALGAVGLHTVTTKRS